MKGIYLVTDRELCGTRGVAAVVAAAARGGACCVQLREKTASTRRFIETAARILTLLAPHRIPLIINDRVDVALAVGAHGVHVGQSDMPPVTARQLLGGNHIIPGLHGKTDDRVGSQQLQVDYLGISPVYATPTKTDTKEPWGLEGVTRIKDFTHHPLVGIGGLDASNAAAVIRAGADCVAVVSAICAAEDPFLATTQLRETVEQALEARDTRLTTQGFKGPRGQGSEGPRVQGYEGPRFQGPRGQSVDNRRVYLHLVSFFSNCPDDKV